MIVLLRVALADGDESEFPATHSNGIEANPAGAKFTIAFATEKSQFHVGELIPLDIVYQFDEVEPFLINYGLAQGSGTARLLEVFCVTPHTGTRSIHLRPRARRLQHGRLLGLCRAVFTAGLFNPQ